MQHHSIALGCLLLALTCPAQQPTLTADVSTVSITTGGTQQFTLQAGSQHGGRFYWILGSLTGTTPGVNLGSLHLPLNRDAWTDITIAWANTGLLTNTRGRLDPSGNAQAFFNVPKITNNRAIGLIFHHAYVVHDANANFFLASNPVALRLVASREIREPFTNDNSLDKAVSGGTWGGGKALPPQIGGTGIHGSFTPSTGTAYVDPSSNQTWFIWSTDNQLIPGNLTQSGKAETVSDGIFHFTDFVLSKGFRVVFEGSNPVVIHVRGKCQIDGAIDLGVVYRDSNQKIQLVVLQPDTQGGRGSPFGFDGSPEGKGLGQPAQRGGPGGGRGGKGGDGCLNTGPNANYNGANGDDVQLKAGHSYAAQAKGTGGPGTPLYPASGKLNKTSGSDFDVLGTYSAYTAAGGGGGGFFVMGGGSQVFRVPPVGGTGRRTPNDSIRMGPKIPGGKAFDPTGATPSGSSLDHYLIGGPGGGGGCSHALLIDRDDRRWQSGAAGSGGGGAIAFRVGQELTMAATGTLHAKGGSGYVYGTNTSELFNLPCAGGAGGGGTILLQVIGPVSLAGKLDTTGGNGGAIDNTRTQVASVFGVRAVAGNGSPGYVRLETAAGAKTTELGTTIPPASAKNVGKLGDVDTRTASQSKFYNTFLASPPVYLRYEVEVKIDGVRRVFSEDPDVGRASSSIFDKDYAGRAHGAQPVYLQVQGANSSNPRAPGPWREFVKGTTDSINLDRADLFRFLLTYDTSGTKSLEVNRVSVFYSQ